ncbi:MAG TPA: ATP-binding cassette domain-containing protein [Clostridia bacterium]|nr:ATP-binding cassette domain-containing protein [Clostridia bacterium]
MLTLKNISKTFNPKTVNEKKALDHFNLHLDKGEFLTVIGSNGAGKSTVMNAVAGIFLIDSGHILLDGEDITFKKDYRRAQSIGRLFQDPLSGTAPSMSIEENLSLAYMRTITHISPFGLNAKERRYLRERLATLDLGLENRLSSPVGLLSGGQRQALTLLMATLNTPKLLLLDEHTAALDPATAEKVLQLTRSIVAENHITCVMITHNMRSSLDLGSRTIMMDSGKIILDIAGEERKNMSVNGLLERFRKAAAKDLDNDRMLLD